MKRVIVAAVSETKQAESAFLEEARAEAKSRLSVLYKYLDKQTSGDLSSDVSLADLERVALPLIDKKFSSALRKYGLVNLQRYTIQSRLSYGLDLAYDGHWLCMYIDLRFGSMPMGQYYTLWSHEGGVQLDRSRADRFYSCEFDTLMIRGKQ